MRLLNSKVGWLMTTKTPNHDLEHEVYLDPKDHKEHINHGMI